MGGRQMVVAVLVGAGLTAAAGGCASGGSGSGSGGSAPATAAPSGSAPAGASAAPASPNGVETLEPREIVERSAQALKDGRSVRVTGEVDSAGEGITIDLAMDADANCAGTMSMAGQGGFRLVKVGQQLWIKPDAAFLDANAGPAIAQLIGDKYLRTTVDNADFAEVGSLCDLNAIIDLVGTRNGPLSAGTRTTVEGAQVISVITTQDGLPGTLYVSVEGRPYPVRLEKVAGEESGRLDFKDFGAQVAATPPAPNQTLDLDELQRESGATGPTTTV
ncbi:hypothetical protein AB0K43_13915 [Kitasatospora sp. NPDC049258]|uniref:hypothetical protein n=1 Tax=Kitasatospora sp. NPDC049258 TaxID=3155394 RepID=UPI00341701A8